MTQSQKRALDAVQNMIEVKTDDVFAHNIMILLFGILNIEHDMDKDLSVPINPNNGSDRLQVPEWIKNVPTPPFVPKDISHPDPCPFPPKVWYNKETEPIKIDCTDNKNGIVYIYQIIRIHDIQEILEMDKQHLMISRSSILYILKQKPICKQ